MDFTDRIETKTIVRKHQLKKQFTWWVRLKCMLWSSFLFLLRPRPDPYNSPRYNSWQHGCCALNPQPGLNWFYVSGSGALLLNSRHRGAGSPMTSTLCPVVCDLPSAPPSSPSHLNSVGTLPPRLPTNNPNHPPSALCRLGHFVCHQIMSAPLPASALSHCRTVSAANCPLGRTLEWDDATGVGCWGPGGVGWW